MKKHYQKAKTQKVYGELGDGDLVALKELVRAVLKTNIALKTFNFHFAQNEEQEKMCRESIENSKLGLKRIAEIVNPETINGVIQSVGTSQWLLFSQILGYFSGSFNDTRLYDFDKELTERKAKEGGEA